MNKCSFIGEDDEPTSGNTFEPSKQSKIEASEDKLPESSAHEVLLKNEDSEGEPQTFDTSFKFKHRLKET